MPGILHFILMLLINSYLLYSSGNPKPYQNLTNSKILNNGLWVQAVYSMVLCITLKLYSLSNCHRRNEMLQLMFNIDETFQTSFHIVYNYTGFNRWTFISPINHLNQLITTFQIHFWIINHYRCKSSVCFWFNMSLIEQFAF